MLNLKNLSLILLNDDDMAHILRNECFTRDFILSHSTYYNFSNIRGMCFKCITYDYTTVVTIKKKHA